MARTRNLAPVPFNRFLTVASAGLVAFLALMQGGLTVSGYRPCGLPPLKATDSLQVAMLELGIAAAAYLVFLLGALRLRKGWDVGISAYNLAIFALLIGQGLLAYMFIRSTVCAG
ncbi:hypothetical protein HJC99_01630 [Candidatus Saccharibacteria bacterium]|nr:hypothetical protein [Candidatus Saccharibacteria bacterium]